MTLTHLIENSSIPEPLIRAVVRQIGGWSSFKESAPDIANHGVDGGFGGFIYYSDTVKFAKRNMGSIRQLAREQAEEFGMGTLEMIQGFACLGDDYSIDDIGACLYGAGGSEDDTQIYNALTWYAGEEVARAYVDTKEQI